MWQVFCLDLSRDFFGVFKTIICNLKIGVVLDIYASRIFLERTRLGKGKFSQFLNISGYTTSFFCLRYEQSCKNKKIACSHFLFSLFVLIVCGVTNSFYIKIATLIRNVPILFTHISHFPFTIPV